MKISVVIPCFNHGAFLREALESVNAQTLPPDEVIVVNDGSTDPDTLRVFEELCGSGPTLIHTENRGPAAARNAAIRAARGRYILPLDADDRISPAFLENTVPILEADPGAGIVYPAAELFGEQTGPFRLEPYGFPRILIGNMIVSTSVFRKADWEAVGGYDEAMTLGWEDYEFWLSLHALGRKAVHAPEAVLHYRRLAGSRTHKLTPDAEVACYARIFHRHQELYAGHIEVLFGELVMLRNDSGRTHARLHEANLALQAANSRLDLVIETVKRSRTWRFRNACRSVARKMGLKLDAFLDS